jgi:D-alanyl-D-alanine carboxypeptidase
MRGLALSLFIVTGLLTSSPTAVAAPYAALVMDARTGEVLHSRSADRRLHPASLTKMMTVYLAIEAVKKGRLSLNQKVKVSGRASRQPPSKIGLRAGQYVTVRDLIRASAVKSANDAAVALAEAVAGSEPAFARLMTQKAQSFGMTRTTFKNAHGLTQSGHLSTARDMAILGRRLFFDHPEYYNIFKRKSTRAAGKTVYATNRRLLSSYRGADGIKTGYTRAAGYNLVASAERGDKRVIAVVFGGKSSRSRNARVAELLDLGFKRAPRNAAIIKPRNNAVAALASAPFPADKPPAPKTLLARSMESLGGAIVAPAAASERQPMSTSRLAPRKSLVPMLRPGSIAAPAPSASLGAGGWQVQVGAFRDQSSARKQIKIAQRLDVGLLAEAAPTVVALDDKLYRARFTGLSEAEARAACAAIKRKGQGCATVSPGHG